MLPITTIIFQVVPVSAATVMMQEPFMLFYELVEGKIMCHSTPTCILTPNCFFYRVTQVTC